MSRTFQSLERYNYRLWFTGNIFASTGQWMQRIAQDWLVLTVLTQGGGVQVGVVTALQFLPILLLSPVAGVIADRFDRRHVVQAAQASFGLLGLLTGVLVLTDSISLPLVYLLAALGGTVTAFDGPARQAFVSELVRPHMLPNAVALNSMAFNLARMLGPAVAGFVIDWVGLGWVFISNAALFLVPVFTVALMRKSELEPPVSVPRERGQIREAVRYVRGRRDIIMVLVVIGVVSFLGLNFQLTSAMMATEVYMRPAGGYGLMSTALAVGAVTGAVLTARRGRPTLFLIVTAAAFFGVGLTILSLAPTYIWFLVLAAPVGVMSQTLMASANASVQLAAEPAFRGRVMALYTMVFMGVTPIGAPLIGWVGETFGARWSMAVGGIASIAVAVGVALFARFHWRIRLRVDPRAHRVSLVIPDEWQPIRGGVAARAHQDELERLAALDRDERASEAAALEEEEAEEEGEIK